MTIKNSLKQLPNEKGYFGDFGGRYVSETLMPLIEEVEQEYNSVKNDSEFQKEFDEQLKEEYDEKLVEFHEHLEDNSDKTNASNQESETITLTQDVKGLIF